MAAAGMKHFDVQKALMSGLSMGDINGYMMKNHLSPAGSGGPAAPSNPLYEGANPMGSTGTDVTTNPASAFPDPNATSAYNSNDDIQGLINQAKAAPDAKTATNALDFAGKLQGLEATSKAAQDQQSKIKTDAQNLLDVLNKKSTMDPADYDTARAKYASDFATDAMGAASAGKDTMMAGSIPQVQGQMTGLGGLMQNLPIVSGLVNKPGSVIDNDQQLREKAILQLQGLGGLQNQPQSTPTAPATGMSVPGLAQNAVSNTKDLVNGILGMPKNILDTAQSMQNQYGSPLQLALSDPGKYTQVEAQMFANPAEGAVNEANQTLGQPMQGGDIAGRMVQNAYQKPVSTALEALTLAKGLGGIGNGIANGAANADAVSSTITSPQDLAAFNGADNQLPPQAGGQLPPINDRTGGITGLQSRALSSVGTPEKNDILANDQEMQKVMQMTTGGTPRDIARQLPGMIGKFDKAVDGYAGQMDDAVKSGQLAPVDLQSKLSDLEQQLRTSDAGQAKPAIVDQILNQVKSQIGNPDDGDTTANYSDINDARKFLNKTTRSSWFKNNMPLVSDADYSSQLKWDASNFLKDTLGSTDPDGQIQGALDNEHAAIKAYPSMSSDALSNGSQTARGVRSVLFRTANSMLNPLRVGIARGAAGTPDASTQAVLGGNLPPLSGLSTLPSIPASFGVGANNPDQFQMLRDMRYGQGNYWANPNVLPNIQQGGKP